MNNGNNDAGRIVDIKIQLSHGFYVEEHQMLNFVKHNRNLMNKGELKEERVEMFQKLMEIG